MRSEGWLYCVCFIWNRAWIRVLLPILTSYDHSTPSSKVVTFPNSNMTMETQAFEDVSPDWKFGDFPMLLFGGVFPSPSCQQLSTARGLRCARHGCHSHLGQILHGHGHHVQPFSRKVTPIHKKVHPVFWDAPKSTPHTVFVCVSCVNIHLKPQDTNKVSLFRIVGACIESFSKLHNLGMFKEHLRKPLCWFWQRSHLLERPEPLQPHMNPSKHERNPHGRKYQRASSKNNICKKRDRNPATQTTNIYSSKQYMSSFRF